MRRLIPALTEWLRNPVIRITPSDEITSLREDVRRLAVENAGLKAELKRVERLYYEECLMGMRVSDENRRLTDENRRLIDELSRKIRKGSEG